MITEQDKELWENAIELSLARGDSSIYDSRVLASNPVYQELGLGSLLSLYIAPSQFLPPVQPDVPGTILISGQVANGFFPTTTIIKDKNKWVIIITPFRDSDNSLINLSVQNYKLTGIHVGKFNTEAKALRYQNYIKDYYEKNRRTLGLKEARQFGPFVTSLSVSYSIDGANQIQFTVIDKNYEMMENNFFMNRRLLKYRNGLYEIGAVEVGPGPGGSPMVTVTAWDEAVQKMKRDKKPSAISGSSVYEYAFNVAKKFGLRFVAEKSNKSQTINKGSGNNSDESVWSVLQSAANQDEFVMYVMDGTMVYGSQKWLLWKFGTDSRTTVDPKTKKSTTKKYCRLHFSGNDFDETQPEDSKKFKVIEWPTIRQSENDPLEGDGTVVVAKPNGCIIRPGHTVIIGPKPTMFKGGYLVTEVSFSEGSPDPVQISFRTPEKPSKQTNNP